MTATWHDPARPLLFQQVRVGLSGPVRDVLVVDGTVRAVAFSGMLDLPAGGVRVHGAEGTLLPGLRDRHVHADQWAIALHRVDLTRVVSAADAIDTVSAFLAQHTELAHHELIIGYGFRDGLWPDIPHKDQLEMAFPGRPVAMVSNDLHTIWASPAALSLLEREHADGVLREQEAFETSPQLNGATAAQLDEWVLQALQRLPELGVTNLMDFEVADTVASWRRRRAMAGRLPVRVECSVYPPYVAEVLDAGLRTGSPIGAGFDDVLVGYAKVFLDGSLNTRTAYCHEPYPGQEDAAAGRGLLLEDPDELVGRIRRAAADRLYYAVHAIGDAANQIALDCFEAAQAPGRIEHAQLVASADVHRFSAPGLIAGVQPAHAAEDRDIAEHHWAGRTRQAYPYGALLAAGGRLELGSDAPVSTLNPWYVMAAAMKRSVDDRPSWHPEHSLTLDQALAASTGGQTAPQVGDTADLVLIAEDLAALDAEELTEVTVRTTVTGGRVTFSQE